MQGVKTVLTDKQLDYLVRHFKDTDNEYLAIRLGISESAVEKHVRTIRKAFDREAATHPDLLLWMIPFYWVFFS